MLELNVTGMTCGHCVRTVTQAVKGVDPEAQVRRVFDDLKSKQRATEYLRLPPVEPAAVSSAIHLPQPTFL